MASRPLFVWLLDLTICSRPALLLLVITSLGALISPLAPLVFARFVDDAASGQLTAWLLVAYVSLTGLSYLLGAIVPAVTQIAVQGIERTLQKTCALRLTRKPGHFFARYSASEVNMALGQASQNLALLMQVAYTLILPAAITAVAAFIVLLDAINLQVALASVLYGLAYGALSVFAMYRSGPDLSKIAAATQDAARELGSLIDNMETVRAFGAGDWFRKRQSDHLDTVFRRWFSYARLHIRITCGYAALLIVQLSINFWLLLPQLRSGAVGVGALVLFNMLIFLLNKPFESAGLAANTLMKAHAAFMPFMEIMEFAEEGRERRRETLPAGDGTLSIDQLEIRREDGSALISGSSMTASRGQITFVTGPSGAGKSTLIRAAAQLLPADDGKITLNGQDLALVSTAHLWNAIGFVPQEVTLFQGSVADNILLGRPYDAKKLRQAANAAGVLDRIETATESFEALVGQRGFLFSGGERQRIGIARALYAEPQLLLLDEPSSALDADTEAAIVATLRTLSERVTIVVVTHRTNAISSDDQIWRMSPGGQIAEAPSKTASAA